MVKCCTYPTLRSLHLERGENQKLAFIAHTKKKKKKVASQTLCRENLLAEIPRDFLEKGFAEETEVTG